MNYAHATRPDSSGETCETTCRAKSMPRFLHKGRITGTDAAEQLPLWSNLNDGETVHDFIEHVRLVDNDTPVLPFGEDEDPVTEFVRAELARLEQDRGAMHRLEKRSNISSGYLSKLKNDSAREMHVGIDFVRKFAPAMGYEDVAEFFATVIKWWNERGKDLVKQHRSFMNPGGIEDPELREAMRSTSLATANVVQRVVLEYPNLIGKRDRWWWVAEIMRVAKEDAENEKGKAAPAPKRRTSSTMKAVRGSDGENAVDATHAAPPDSATELLGSPTPRARRRPAR